MFDLDVSRLVERHLQGTLDIGGGHGTEQLPGQKVAGTVVQRHQ